MPPATPELARHRSAAGQFHAFLWTAERGMEDLDTLGGAESNAFGISQTGEVVGIGQTPGNTFDNAEAFLWTRGGGMRSLGTLGGPFSFAFSINTHQQVVGQSLNARGDLLPFIWTPERGMRRLPMLGGDAGRGGYLNEFGEIAGETTTCSGRPPG